MRITGAILLVLAIGLSGCIAESYETATGGDALQSELLITNASGQQTIDFAAGEDVNFKLTVTNPTEREITYTFTPPGDYLRISRGETPIWSKHYGTVFIQVIETRTIGPGETLTYTATWTGVDNEEVPVAPGDYTVEAGANLFVADAKIDQPPPVTLRLHDPESTHSPLKESLAITDKFDQETSSFSVGDEINIEVTVTNTGDREITYSFTHPADYLRISRGDALIWSKYHGQEFDQAIQTDTLDAGQTIAYTTSWTGHDNDGNRVPPGDYTVEAGVTFFVEGEIVARPAPEILHLQ